MFGKVIKGMDVVDKIATSETKAVGRLSNLPVKTISIIKARLVQPKPVIKLKGETPKPASLAK